jgi:RsiW-degrading membrane proteinase PrsW (M82 family)
MLARFLNDYATRAPVLAKIKKTMIFKTISTLFWTISIVLGFSWSTPFAWFHMTSPSEIVLVLLGSMFRKFVISILVCQ